MKLKKLTENIYYSECDSTVDRPTLGYVLGKNISVMIDAGNSRNHVVDYYTSLKEQCLRMPKYCVITHWHWDHTFGMHALEMETISHSKTNEELRRLSLWAWDDATMKQRLITGEEVEFADEHIRAEYGNTENIKVVSAVMTFDSKLTIDCGDITCECIHLASAHSEDSVVIYIPEEKVIFIGDIYNDDFYNNHHRDIEKTEELYQNLSKIDFDIAIPGHSNPIKKGDILNFLHRFF